MSLLQVQGFSKTFFIHWQGVTAALAKAPAETRLLVEVKVAELAESKRWVESIF